MVCRATAESAKSKQALDPLRESILDSYQQTIICSTHNLHGNFKAKQVSRKPWDN
jgi:hypothetical protein